MRFTERSASTISGSIRFRDFWAFPIHRGGMFARNLKNLRTAEPELDTKSLASRGIAGRLRISNPRTTLPRNQDYCAYQSECGDHLVRDWHCVEVQRWRPWVESPDYNSCCLRVPRHAPQHTSSTRQPLLTQVGPAHATVPNSAPTPAVNAMASAPQNVTRIAPTVIPAPPARAASPPRMARNTSEVPETRGIRPAAGAMAVTRRGMAAPMAKLPADANAAWIGRARRVSEIPSSSRACAPIASWAINCSATCFASEGSSPRAT